MPNSRHSDAIVSPSLSRITNRIRSSTTEPSFHGILLSAPFGPKSVTHVSGTFCYPCLGTDIPTLHNSRALHETPLHCPSHLRTPGTPELADLVGLPNATRVFGKIISRQCVSSGARSSADFAEFADSALAFQIRTVAQADEQG